MNVRVLVEDTSSSAEFQSEHGLSLYIETRQHRLLFDFGQSALFLENAEKMGVDVGGVDMAILSHGHYDHGGGIAAFFQHNRSAEVLVQEHAFEPHFSIRAGGQLADIGLDQALEHNPRVRKMRGAQALDAELTVFSGVQGGILWPTANRTLLKASTGDHVPDDFYHEQNLIITEDGEDVLFTGCAHNGIVNILEAACALRGRPPRAVVGGFHLVLKEGPDGGDAAFAAQVAEALGAYGADYYTGHCTGEGGVQLLRTMIGPRVHRLSTGLVFNP
jgi:7,8-dihydropterin-6-yl-methyl-4-(beta-D-ribofuranosyl)aminobenzene 5'-phosphate synthase